MKEEQKKDYNFLPILLVAHYDQNLNVCPNISLHLKNFCKNNRKYFNFCFISLIFDAETSQGQKQYGEIW